MIIMSENIVFMAESTICPIVMMITALVIWKFPAEFRGFFAYHTVLAEKTPQTWTAAQSYFGKIGFFSNLAALVLTLIAFVPVIVAERLQSYGALVCMTATAVQVAVVLIDIFIVEGLLKKHFDKDGNPRQ